MKIYKIIMIFLVLIGCFIILDTKSLSVKLLNKVIVIDPGHGGLDPGTLYSDIYEKDLNLDISLKLRNELIKNGAVVVMTRDGDYDLGYPNSKRRKKSDFDNRIKLINNVNADLYLSIHLNYLSDTLYYGPQVFYDRDNEKLAITLQNSMNNKLNGNRVVKQIPIGNYMYNKLSIDGVLIECGFLSNSKERELLITSEYQDKIVESIIDGLIDYF